MKQQMRLMWLSGLFLLCAIPAHAESAWNWNSRTLSARADITGDGKSEKIRLEKFVGKDKRGKFNRRYFRLTVNNQSIYDAALGDGLLQGFRLANIDKRDKSKEIVVEIAGFDSLDWSGYAIYWFDGKAIRRVTHEPLTVHINFYGNGHVAEEEYLGGPLSAKIPYQLGRSHMLHKVQQNYFKAEAHAVVKQAFPIYLRPSLDKIVMLRVGTKVKILKSDLGDWLYLRAGRQTFGWMNTRWNSKYAAFGWAAAG